ncbi:tripartite tricarboxylate transporter permease [Acidaminobacter hydrogenoformans]|uniref:Putative tricarboxylic transport membrane protein n=1 Tax=Acidaminobacter hydrogenoformans DSM 2784 TaxID=1120920 RepID=A0A1G5S4H9_9FIRM|nr:tripartite tricarboxylate transporter permease [Acidaminobacter hydrogenoformans]SCZ81067.1 putative tricarboxylic transport membrane protein [Acidaminobacter hydrogenoformans DSM 2784]
MDTILGIFSVIDIRFVVFVFMGAVAGLFVGSIPGLSVSMATALLVSITYSWNTVDALATIMGVYVVGVYSGAISAILINIPGAPSSVVTTLDGHPLAIKNKSHVALSFASMYSFIGSAFGLIALMVIAKPVSNIALKFTPMDYFLLALFGLATVGAVTSKNYTKGLLSAAFGLVVSMIGLDPIVGTPRMVMGIYNLQSGIAVVPALIGLFGFSEVLSVVYTNNFQQIVMQVDKSKVKLKNLLKHWKLSMYTSTIGTIIGALPGAGGPVAAFIAYNEAKRIVKNPETPFGEGAVEGIVASESANNACIGGALIPMLTLAVPGDAVTAILLSVFYIHGLKPGPMFLIESPEMFSAILAGGFIGCIALLVLAWIVGPKISKVISVPKNILLPMVAVLSVVGSFATNNRLFDVILMFVFGLIGFVMNLREYPTAPMILAIVLGSMMDANFRRSVSLASSTDHMLLSMFGKPITIFLLTATILVIVTNIPQVKQFTANLRARGK